jgi:uncharacterized membrane protein
VWLQAQRIEALARRIAELELELAKLRAGAPAAEAVEAPAAVQQAVQQPAEEPLLLTEVVPDDVLVLDTVLPEASNDAGAPAASPVTASPVTVVEGPRMHSPLLLDERAPEAPPEPEGPSAAPAMKAPGQRLDQRLAAIGRSLLNGQSLGALAIALALLAPALSNAPLWPWWALWPYLVGVAAAGFAVSVLRRWTWVSLVPLMGLYGWFFAALGAEEVRGALVLVVAASFGGASLMLRPPLPDETKARLTWSDAHKLGPSIAVSVSSVLLIWAWIFVAPAPSGQIAGPALISVFHAALAALAVNRRAALPATLAITIAALVVGCIAYLQARFFYPPLGPDFYPTTLIGAFVVAFSALFSNPHHSGRKTAAGAGGIGAAILTLLAAASRGDGWHSYAAWGPLFAGAAMLFASAWWSEARAPDRTKDAAIDLWAGSGAVLALVGVESAFPAETRAVGHAIAALVFAVGLVWRGWRVAGWASLTAALLAIGQALSPDLIGGVLTGGAPLWAGLLILAGAAALLFGGSTVIRRSNDNIGVAEALSAAAVAVALVGVLVALRWIAAGGAGARLDTFVEASLRVLVLMAAGLALLPRVHEKPGPIGAWRGHVLLGLGLLYALLSPGLAINPWWGAPGRAVITDLPLLNALALAFLAPAALAFVAANRLYPRQLLHARCYAAAGAAMVLLWLALEIRHAFHSLAMAEPSVGLFESACYALAALAVAIGLVVAARTRAARSPHGALTQDLTRVMRGAAWGALGFAVLIMLLVKHPIWGTQDSTTSNAFSTLLAVLAQIGGVLLTLALGRALSLSKEAEPTRFATAAVAATFAWSAGHSVIRWLHHRGYMDDEIVPLGLEGMLHAVWPLALVTAAAQLTRVAPGRDTVRAYLFDLQAIWAAAIWPAAAFAGLGLWVVFNPWWGALPADAETGLAAAAALGLMLIAAALTFIAPDAPHVYGLKWLVPASLAVCAAHLFVAATLIVRWLYHDGAMSEARAGEAELWVYTAVWLLFGAAALGLSAMRNDLVLRWVGLAILALTTVKVFFIDTAERFSEVVRAGSFIAFIIVVAAAWRYFRRNHAPPGPGDLVTVRPSARRERRRVRRRMSQ